MIQVSRVQSSGTHSSKYRAFVMFCSVSVSSSALFFFCAHLNEVLVNDARLTTDSLTRLTRE